MLFSILSFLTKPKNLIDDYYVEIDNETCRAYSQNDLGIWSFYAIIRRNPIRKD